MKRPKKFVHLIFNTSQKTPTKKPIKSDFISVVILLNIYLDSSLVPKVSKKVAPCQSSPCPNSLFKILFTNAPANVNVERRSGAVSVSPLEFRIEVKTCRIGLRRQGIKHELEYNAKRLTTVTILMKYPVDYCYSADLFYCGLS